MFIFFPPLLIGFTSQFIYILLPGFTIFCGFFVQQVIDKSLHSLHVYRTWKRYYYLVVNSLYCHCFYSFIQI